MATTDLLYRLRADGSELDRELKRSQKAFRGFSKIAKRSLAVAATGAAALGATLGGLAVKAASDFEQSIASAGAKSSATAEQLTQLSNAAKQAGIQSAFGASEAGDALGFLAQAGLTVNEQTKALPGVLNLASAGALELATAADIATNVLSGFGLGVEELERVNDVLAKAANSSNTSVEELGQALSYAAPAAAGLGIPIEETAAVIGRLSDAGIKGSRAGTAINATLRKMGDVASALDVKFTNADLASVGFVGVLSELEDAGLTAANAMDLFGGEAGPGVAALLNQGTAAILELDDALLAAGGTAAEVAERQLNTLPGQLKLFKGSAETLGIELAQSLTPVMKSVTTEFVSFTNELLTNDEALLDFKTTVAETADSTGKAIKDLAPAITAVTTTIGLMIDAVNALDIVASSLAGGIGLLALRYKEAKAALDGSAESAAEVERFQARLAKSGEELAEKVDRWNAATMAGVKVGDKLAKTVDGIGGAMRSGAKDALNMAKALDELDTRENRARSGRSGYGARRTGGRGGYGDAGFRDSRGASDPREIAKQLAEIEKREAEAQKSNTRIATKGLSDAQKAADALAKTVQKAHEDAIEASERFWESLVAEGQRVTHAVDPIAAFNAEIKRLAELLNYGVISTKTYLAAVDELAEGLKEPEKKMEKLGERTQWTQSELSKLGEGTAGLIFDEFERNLFDPFSKSADQMVRDFAVALGQMAFRAAASKVLQIAFGGPTANLDNLVAGNFASGGLVRGPGTGTSDSIPARLSDGEFVMRARAVEHYGAGFLAKLNAIDVPRQGYAAGGPVKGASGDTNVTVANLFSEEELERFLSTKGGEKVILNILRRNGVTPR